MKRWIAPLLLMAPAAHMPPAQAQDSLAIETQAVQIAMRSAEFLASRDAFSFGWFVSYDEVSDSGAKITYIRSGTTSMVRSKGFVSHTESGDTYRDYYWNGDTFSVVSPNEEFYSSAEFKGDFDSLVEAVENGSGTVLPMWSMMSKNLPEVLMLEVEQATYLGTSLVAGQSAHHLLFSEPEEDWQLWISTNEDEPWPLMLVGTEKTIEGQPQYRVHMDDWDVTPEPVNFTYEPDDGAVRVIFPGNALIAGSASE